MVTVFSWGYQGWGNATRELLAATSVLELHRGYEPPLFADIRASRSVRAAGFRDKGFEVKAGRRRYRWLPGLGNGRVLTGRGPMRLIHADDVHELLGLALAQQAQNRRVIFFCSCGSPWVAGRCHRQLVRRDLVRVGRSLGVQVTVEEWPGGQPSRRPVPLKVRAEVIKALRRGATVVPLGASTPPPLLLHLPHGSIVELRGGDERQLVSLAAPSVRAGRWGAELFVRPVDAADTVQLLQRYTSRIRREYRLDVQRP
jgi:hypothetical protein